MLTLMNHCKYNSSGSTSINEGSVNPCFHCSYQHVLSGAKRPQQAEARGGVIADEMGLGKPLVILSTIASSLDRAEAFAMAESQQESSQLRRKQASKATLIIAPSSRESLPALKHVKV